MPAHYPPSYSQPNAGLVKPGGGGTNFLALASAGMGRMDAATHPRLLSKPSPSANLVGLCKGDLPGPLARPFVDLPVNVRSSAGLLLRRAF